MGLDVYETRAQKLWISPENLLYLSVLQQPHGSHNIQSVTPWAKKQSVKCMITRHTGSHSIPPESSLRWRNIEVSSSLRTYDGCGFPEKGMQDGSQQANIYRPPVSVSRQTLPVERLAMHL
jgi:hypothetical protein